MQHAGLYRTSRPRVYNQHIKTGETPSRGVWKSHPGMGSWYKNAAGRVTTTSPWRLVDYWAWTKTPDLADFAFR